VPRCVQAAEEEYGGAMNRDVEADTRGRVNGARSLTGPGGGSSSGLPRGSEEDAKTDRASNLLGGV